MLVPSLHMPGLFLPLLGWAIGDTVTLRLTEPSLPAVSSVTLTSDPGTDDYAIEDEIEATVTFSESVTVDD